MKRNTIASILIIALLGLVFGTAIGVQFHRLSSASRAATAPASRMPRPAAAAPAPQRNRAGHSEGSEASAMFPKATPWAAGTRAEVLPSVSKDSEDNHATPEPLHEHESPSLPPPAAVAEEEHMAQPKPMLSGSAPVVCIDPGHPSETSDGAHAHGLSENTLNWQVALKLRDRLEAMGIRCVMTKDGMNQRRTNRERAEIANRAGAAVFVRLHCDVGSGHGYVWYYPDREGHKYGVTGPPKPVQQASRRAAYIINEAMKPVLRGYLRSNPIKTDASTFVGGKQGGVLTGSIFARVPTALIEMCFINQKDDAHFIASEAGQEKMAEALAQGIYAYTNR
jgi:N-acetylmuramoyl-L-alanine amidase